MLELDLHLDLLAVEHGDALLHSEIIIINENLRLHLLVESIFRRSESKCKVLHCEVARCVCKL